VSRLSALALLGVAIALGGWFAWQRWSRGESRAETLLRIERALAGSEPLAAASADLEQLRPLLGPLAPELEKTLLRAAGIAEAGAAGEASRLFVSLSRSAGRVESSAVVLGHFDVAALEAAFAESSQGRAGESARPGELLMQIERVDPESCEVTQVGVALAPERIVVAEPGALAALLERLGDAGLALAEPGRAEPLLALHWRPGLSLPDGVSDPALRALVEELRGSLGPGTSLQASLGRARRSLSLEVELGTGDADGARALLQRVKASGDRLHGLPGLERWWGALAWSAEAQQVRGRARLGREAAALGQIADDALLLAAQAFQAAAFEAGPVAEPWPPTFREQQSLAAIARYGGDAPLAGAADAVAGPFGIRIERVRAGDGLEIELRAVGPDVANLPPPDVSPRVVVESVSSQGGEPLLAQSACGPSRGGFSLPLLRSTPARIVEAIGPLRLRSGVALDAVASIRGWVELDLPVRIGTASGEAAPGARLEGPEVALEVIARSPIGLAYRVRGDDAALLYVRGLGSAGAALSGRQLWEAQLPGSGERIGALRHSGALASVEAVFALERERGRWDFELESARPGSDGEALQVQSSSFIDYSAEQYDREFGVRGVGSLAPRKSFAALADAGPFRIGVGELADADGQIAPALTVLAPDIPNLSYNASGLELELERVVLRDARSFSPGVRLPVSPGHRFGNLELEAEVRPATGVAVPTADVERLSGRLRLRLPRRVDALDLAPVEPGRAVDADGVSFELVELVRDGFTLRMRGPLKRFFSARAFAEAGHELSVKRLSIAPEDADGAREIRFRVQGQPRRIEIQLARGVALRSYAFELALPAPAELPAAPQP